MSASIKTKTGGGHDWWKEEGEQRRREDKSAKWSRWELWVRDSSKYASEISGNDCPSTHTHRNINKDTHTGLQLPNSTHLCICPAGLHTHILLLPHSTHTHRCTHKFTATQKSLPHKGTLNTATSHIFHVLVYLAWCDSFRHLSANFSSFIDIASFYCSTNKDGESLLKRGLELCWVCHDLMTNSVLQWHWIRWGPLCQIRNPVQRLMIYWPSDG